MQQLKINPNMFIELRTYGKMDDMRIAYLSPRKAKNNVFKLQRLKNLLKYRYWEL